MTDPKASFGVVGALSAFPLRVATAHARAIGADLHRGITRRTTHVVFGRMLLTRDDSVAIATRVAAVGEGVIRISEAGLLRMLGIRPYAGMADLSRDAIIDQAGIGPCAFDLLVLFDAFEHHAEPFSFRDLILARKYAGLLAAGSSWKGIALSVHRGGPVGGLTALDLQSAGTDRIVQRDAQSLVELDGQRLLGLGEELEGEDAEAYFALAETAEANGLFAEAATLFGQCTAIDRTDATAAFNQGNCLRAIGDTDGAMLAYASALKREPDMVEAWFNVGGVLREIGRIEAARTHLEEAVARDPGYADALYNLGALEFEVGDLAAARDHWRRYLEFDTSSEWARKARAGIALADRSLRLETG